MGRRETPPYFAFYPIDFTSDGVVEAMSTKAVGAYILLLCKAWYEKPAGTLPKDDRVLAAWARMSALEWEQIRSEVVQAFKDDGLRWRQKRLMEEHSAAIKQINQKVEAGRLGGLAKSKHRYSDASNLLEQRASGASLSPSVSMPSDQEGSAEGKPAIPAGLDTPEFAKAWAGWLAMRSRKWQDSMDPFSTQAVLVKLAGWGLPRALAALAMATERGWKNLHEESPHLNGVAGVIGKKPTAGEPGGPKVRAGKWE